MPPKKAQAATSNKQKGESLARRTTFYVNTEWEAGSGPDDCTHIRGQMYVECLEPQRMTQDWPIILVHGDYHSSQVWLTKPDGDPGWASYFVGKGFRVYLVDLPGTGKSSNITKEEIEDAEVRSIKGSQIEREVTAPEVFNHITDLRWSTVQKHDKWPGASTKMCLLPTGRKNDGNFDRYCASLTSLFFTIEQRQTLAQNALRCLLNIIKKAVLIGEGTGATASWLAADVVPELVVGVVAIEPPGPPFCDGTVSRNGKRRFDSFTTFNPHRLKYGLSAIPLTYDPPVRPELGLRELTGLLSSSYSKEPTGLHPLDLALYVRRDTGKSMVLQYSPGNIPAGFIFKEKMTHGEGTMHVRKLANLAKMRHVIITGQASSHSEYDGSTMYFMQQAGLTVDCGFLERYQIFGNGHLMFLEENSDEVAAHIMRWIQNKAGKVDEPVVPSEEEVTIVSAPTALLSRRSLEGDQQHFSSRKRYKRDATHFPTDSAMLPPPPPFQASLPRASARAKRTPVSNAVEPSARETYPQRSALSIPPAFAIQGSASVAFSNPMPAQYHPPQVALEENESGGAGARNSQGLQVDQAEFHTPPEYPAHSPVAASPRGHLACKSIHEQKKGSKRDQIGDVGEAVLTGPSNSLGDLYTDYKFDLPSPQAISRNGHDMGLSDFTHMPLQQTNPFSYATTPNTASRLQNPYVWSIQGGSSLGPSAQAPRFMPNFQPTNDAGTNAESMGATNDWFLNSLASDPNVDQDESHFDMNQYKV